jgi:tetratricopeptide (TPR) repeat protein
MLGELTASTTGHVPRPASQTIMSAIGSSSRRVLWLICAWLVLSASGVMAVAPARAEIAYDDVMKAYGERRWADVVELATAFDAANPAHRHRAAVLYVTGIAHEELDALELAIATYDKMLELFPGYINAPDARMRAAGIAFEQRKFDDAIARYERCIETGLKAISVQYVNYQIGVAAFKSGGWQRTIAIHDALAKDAPDSNYTRVLGGYRALIDPPMRPDENGIDQDYAGKYAGMPIVATIRAQIVEARAAGAKLVKERFGATVDPSEILIRMIDKGAAQDGNHASTDLAYRGGKAIQLITVYMEYAVTGQMRIELTIPHELIHAVQRVAVGDAYYFLPKWLREGIAVWGANQGEERIDLLLSVFATHSGGNPASLVDGIDGDHSFRDYAEDYLAIAWIDRHCQAGDRAGVRELWDLIVQGKSCREALEAVAGRKYDAWAATVREYALERVLARSREPHDAYKTLLGYRLGTAAFYASAHAIISKHPDWYIVPNVVLLRARAYLSRDRHADALADLDMLLGPLAHRTNLASEAGKLRCELLAKMPGREDDTRAACEAYLRDYEYSASRATFVRELLSGLSTP